jgi:hypothetical protein
MELEKLSEGMSEESKKQTRELIESFGDEFLIEVSKIKNLVVKLFTEAKLDIKVASVETSISLAFAMVFGGMPIIASEDLPKEKAIEMNEIARAKEFENFRNKLLNAYDIDGTLDELPSKETALVMIHELNAKMVALSIGAILDMRKKYAAGELEVKLYNSAELMVIGEALQNILYVPNINHLAVNNINMEVIDDDGINGMVITVTMEDDSTLEGFGDNLLDAINDLMNQTSAE